MSEARPSRETWRVMNLDLAIDETESRLRERAHEAAGVGAEEVRGFRIARKSVDARRSRGGKRRIRFVVQADLVLEAGFTSPAFERARRAGRVKRCAEPASLELASVHPSLAGARVVVVGSGPAGLFAALVLARGGCRVDLLDRGPGLHERGRAMSAFVRTREPDPEANLLFGEGGAGTYSDGKLYSRVDHPLELPILDELVDCGAPPEIRYDSRAHIGTDRLHRVLPRLRGRLEDAGVRFHWMTRMDSLVIKGEGVRSVRAVVSSAGELPCDALVLAVGHSARDSWQRLAEQGVVFEAKPFQLGVRIEHPQALIDAGRYGTGPEAALLGPASYGLVCRAQADKPGAHTFCMCPGGQIVATVNGTRELCTNGMSNSRHSSPWANAGVVTTVGPREFGSGPFAGVDLQRRLEGLFFEAGGSDYRAPAQWAPDFLAGRASRSVGPTSYKLGVTPGRIDALLPPRIRDALRRGLERFDRQIAGFAGPEGLLVGIESRSSGPVRMPRDPESFRAADFANLIPVGEGAGYAGGIMSSAIDGARAAQALLAGGL
ncbi:MAG: NAD(P)/FAD-dependent oxidoreductase [Deltaproteobacteria bacterium]|nr:NAD(P)/FAD-dependent oxidoreductase [Deltaproteobacteria bacterium]MBW2417954.1 NAD(P)/FAD-dependent oxidoreductase [Deltaproteobacteria bacterium]